MRICLIASSRFPVAEPFAGGLEAHTAALARGLIERGHTVSVFAAPGSDPRLNIDELEVLPFSSSEAARTDVGASPEVWMQEHHAYLGLMLDLVRRGRHRFDVIHNNSLHHLPIAMAEATGLPMVTTLHTPPVGWLESAIRFGPPSAVFVAVSRHTALAWAHAVEATVVLNGVDTSRWRPGPGGPRAVWAGRIVPEKGPHLAISAAIKAGIGLDLAGPVLDRSYFRQEVEPRLGSCIRYLGHLSTAELASTVGSAAVAVVSPRWDEPYGLVAAEAMSCGTPVAAFARGALPELLTPAVGALAEADDTDALAAAIQVAVALDRTMVRRHAIRECSVERMVDAYERLYGDVCTSSQAA
jgi:glycosyltransferase involved in cell wall biosynthesis